MNTPRTHFADNDTLAYIAKIEADLAAAQRQIASMGHVATGATEAYYDADETIADLRQKLAAAQCDLAKERSAREHLARVSADKQALQIIDALRIDLAAAQERIRALEVDAVVPTCSGEELHIVFDGPPSHESGRFVEVETADGKSVNAGEWVQSGDYWHLVLTVIRGDK